jgi:hypothetical protein
MSDLLNAATNAHDVLTSICEFLANGTPVVNGSDLHADALAYRDQLAQAIAAEQAKQTPAESAYEKAIRTGVKPAIWPPISMTAEELDHFRRTHGIES